MATSTRQVSGGAETYFAKKLASNEKTVRDKAVKKLRTWISTRRSVSSGLTESDMLKLWKGLFYCMWMSDKPKVQEELAETIAQLLHSFQITTAAVDYLDGFYKTICREWHGIDRLRLDKFYLLIRKFVYQSIVFLKNHGWKNEVVESFNIMLENGPLSTSNESMLVPDGVKTHVIQVYLEELLKCETPQIPRSVLLQLLQPFIRLLATSKSKVITKTVSEEIFDKLLKNVTEHQQDGCSLKMDFQAMNDEFFSWASRKDIPTRNRRILYGYIDKFKVIPKENDCDSTIQQKQVNGLDESTHEARVKCNDTMEASVNKCNPISMDINGDKACKVHTKKIKKGEEWKQNDVVEGDARMCDMDSSAVNESVKKKRSRKRGTLSQDCATMANGSEVSVEDNIAIYEDSEIKEEHDKQFLSECVEDSKTGKKVKGRKRKGDSKTGSEENIPTINEDVKSIKKRKRGKPNGNKLCDETQGGDIVDKHGKKKKKLKNKSVVVQDSNEVALVGIENDVKDKLSKEAEASGNKGSEIMNITSDSLDGSYLGTFPKQARNVTSFGENVVKVFKKSTVQDTNNTKTKIKDTPRIDSSADSLCQSDLRLVADTITNTSEEATEIAKGEDINLTPDSMPPAMFLRHAQKKVKANTEPRTRKERKKMTPGNQASSSKKKKVRIELSKNTSHSTRDYRQILKCSPVIPFDSNKKPVQSSLKTPPTSASKPTTASSSQPRKRPTAVDFF